MASLLLSNELLSLTITILTSILICIYSLISQMLSKPEKSGCLEQINPENPENQENSIL